jgi:ferredoxin
MDVTRCIVCFDCLKTCPSDGVNYKFSFFKGSQIKIRRREDFIGASDTGEFIMARHRFFLTSCALVLGIFGHSYGRHPQRESDSDSTLVNEGINLSDPQAVDSHVQPVTPPGSVSQAHFVQVCTACHLCIATCPAQVIQPAIKDYGLTGIMQPKMDYHVSFCTYDCVLCTQICPTGAIMPLTIDEKKLIQIGKSRFIKKECIVYTKNTACGACSEHCPTKAVAMVPYQYGLTLPEVNNEICVGCGACEYACPTDPKAIVVDANPVHLIAKLPANIKIENKVDYKEDFPF